MFAARDFLGADLPAAITDVERDLDLPRLYDAMAGDDPVVRSAVRQTFLDPLSEPTDIEYRQQVLADFRRYPEFARQMYALAADAIAAERKVFPGWLGRTPEAVLHRAIDVIGVFVGMLRRLRALADANAPSMRSPGLRTFTVMLAAELSDAYFDEISSHLRTLQFRSGLMVSAEMGEGLRGTGYVLRTPRPGPHGLAAIFHHAAGLSFSVSDRDEAGFRALSELRDRGLNPVADAAARSADHILAFFTALQREIGFYLGALALEAALNAIAAPTCAPTVTADRLRLAAHDLYDPALAIATDRAPVGNNLAADGADIVVITGANQGGKSTFLRAIGVAFVMMQSGMNVASTAFTATPVTGVFTHFKREEDRTMRSGKLDEELSRMSDIADHLRPHGLLLSNESFSSTNEREGSEIARQVLAALRDVQVRSVVVTHLYDLASTLESDPRGDARFLRAERDTGGGRPFRITPGEPLPTSFGADLYRSIFGADDADDSAPKGDMI